MKREGFVFYRSFKEAISNLDDSTYRRVVDVISDYALDGKLPECSGVVSTIFKLVKPQIDANNKRYENGKKGGRKPNSNQTETKQEPNGNQTVTKIKPRRNQDVTIVEPKEKDKVKVKDKVKEINILSTEPESDSVQYADVEAVILNDGSEWKPTLRQYEEYCRLYGNVDVKQEFALMRGWCLGNPSKRKTKSGVARFVTSWLSKSQNQGGKSGYRPPNNSVVIPMPHYGTGNNTDGDLESTVQRIKKLQENMKA